MNRTTVAYLLSYALSVLGSTVAAVALPLVVLTTTGSVAATGLVAVAAAVPAALAGVAMGTLVDRVDRRRSAVVFDLISSASVAALPLLDATVGLAVGWFVLCAVVGSFGDVPGLTAREAMLPAVLARAGVSAERLLGARESIGAAALFLGPAVAGVLVARLDPVSVLWVTASLTALGALITLLLPPETGRVTRTEGHRPRLREGWHVLRGSALLRSLLWLILVFAVALAAVQGLLLPVYFTDLGRPDLLGAVLSALAIGLLVGGGTVSILGGRGRRRTWLLVGLLTTAVGFSVLSSLGGVWLVLVGAAVLGLGAGLMNTVLGVLFVEHIPDAVRGRVLGLQNALVQLTPGLGIGLAAVMVEVASLRTGALLLAGAWVAAVLLAAWSRSLRDVEVEVEVEVEEMT